jgi:hypothetical protein
MTANLLFKATALLIIAVLVRHRMITLLGHLPYLSGETLGDVTIRH